MFIMYSNYLSRTVLQVKPKDFFAVFPCSHFGIGALHDSVADMKKCANCEIVLSTAHLKVLITYTSKAEGWCAYMAFSDSKPFFEVSKQQKFKVLNELHHPGLFSNSKKHCRNVSESLPLQTLKCCNKVSTRSSTYLFPERSNNIWTFLKLPDAEFLNPFCCNLCFVHLF